MATEIKAIHSGFMPLLAMISETARIEAEIQREGGKPTATPAPSSPAADPLMTLADAAALPELGGVVSIKQMREAIRRRELISVQLGGPGGTRYVTRSHVLSWISKCHADHSPHASDSDRPSTTPKASSGRARSGASSTDAKKKALAAALKTARELSKR